MRKQSAALALFVSAAALVISSACGKGPLAPTSPGPPPGPGIPPPPPVIQTTSPVVQQLYLGIEDGSALGQVFWWIGRYDDAIIPANVRVDARLYASVPLNVAFHVSMQIWKDFEGGDWRRIGNGFERDFPPRSDGNANSAITFNLAGAGTYKVICLVYQISDNSRSGAEGPFTAMP